MQRTLLDLKLSLYRALVGAIPATLRAVVLEFDEDVAIIHAYFDGALIEYDIELLEVATTEVMADTSFGEFDKVRLEVHRIDFPEPLPKFSPAEKNTGFLCDTKNCDTVFTGHRRDVSGTSYFGKLVKMWQVDATQFP